MENQRISGRAANLGEVVVGDKKRGKLTVSTNLQAFALRRPRSLRRPPELQASRRCSATNTATFQSREPI
jgi:hypothetical protein